MFETVKRRRQRVSEVLSALSNVDRLHIVCLLSDGEVCAGDLAKKTRIKRSSMSQHLNVLKDARLITYRREHRVLYYSISDPLVHELLNTVENSFSVVVDV